MLPWLRSAAVRAAGHVPALLTLALLAALGVVGARYDWALPSLASLGGASDPLGDRPAEATTRVLAASPESGTASAGRPAAGRRRIEFASPEAIKKAGIDTRPVEVRDLTQCVVASGMVDYEPGLYARLTARASGTVWRVDKEIGDSLRKGDVLALLDSSEVGRAKAEFLQSLAQVKVRTATLQRLKTAGQVGAVPERSLQDAEATLREARIHLFNDQQALLNLGLPLRLHDVEDLPDDQLARRLRLLGLPDALARELNPETLTANLLPLTAPFDGLVVERDAAVGEVILPTQPKTLFIVADVRQLHIDLDVNPEDMAAVRVGQTVTFQTDGGATTAVARVSHLSPEVDEKTRRVRVHAGVTNPDGRLRPNAFGTGRILVRERPRVPVVPGEAIQADGSVHFVFVRVSETSFEERPVEPGLRDGDLVEVRGVQAGEQVATTGSFVLKSELLKERITGGDD